MEPHRCRCGHLVDPWGRQSLSCRFAKGTHARHWKINDIIDIALTHAGVLSTLEPEGLCRRDGKHTDGLTPLAWAQGKSTVCDYTCHDTTCQSYIAGTSKKAGKAAEQAKSNLYSELSADSNVIPVAIETFGSWGSGGRLK